MALFYAYCKDRHKRTKQIMCKREFCEQIVALVAKITDLTVVDIMSHTRRPEIVDARYLAVYVMLKKGIQVNRVAEFMTMTERNVYHVLERFDDRKDYGDPMIEQYYNRVLKALK